MQNTKENTMTQNKKILILRAFAIIAVVMIHTGPRDMSTIIIRPFINFAVALFIFLSGYMTPVKVEKLGVFYKKRLLRTLVPYILWTLVFAYIYGTWDKLGWNLLTANGSGAMYYMFVYMQFVLLTPLIGKLAASKWNWTGWLIAPAFTIIFEYLPRFAGVPMGMLMSIGENINCFVWFTYYYLGMLLGNDLLQKKYNSVNLIFVYVLTLALQMGEGYLWTMRGTYNVATQVKLSVLLTASVLLLLAHNYLKNPKWKWQEHFLAKPLLLLGEYSFGVYFAHQVVMARVSLYLKFPFCLNSLVVIIIAFLGVFVIGKICGDKISRYLGLK